MIITKKFHVQCLHWQLHLGNVTDKHTHLQFTNHYGNQPAPHYLQLHSCHLEKRRCPFSCYIPCLSSSKVKLFIEAIKRQPAGRVTKQSVTMCERVEITESVQNKKDGDDKDPLCLSIHPVFVDSFYLQRRLNEV